MDKRVLLLVLLISTPVIPRRSSSGGGGGGGGNFNRGSSGARGNPSSGNFGGQQGGGNFQGGGQPFRPQTGPSNNFGGQPGGNFQPRPNQTPYRPTNTGTGGASRQTSPVRPTNTGTSGGVRQAPVNPVTNIGWNLGGVRQTPDYGNTPVYRSSQIGNTGGNRQTTMNPVNNVGWTVGVRQTSVYVNTPVYRSSQIGNTGGNRQQPGGGFVGGNNNFRPTNNFGGPSSFNSAGVGSRASSGGWKTALAAGALGAVGGVVAWEAGKAIIRSAEQPFNHGGRSYYFDNNGNKQLNGQQMCSMPLSELQKIDAGATTTTTTTTVAPSATVDPNASTTTVAPTAENVLNTIQYPSGDRPKTVTWGCKAGLEVCCGTDCCAAPAPPVQQGSRPSATDARSTIGTVAVLVVIFCLLLCCCGCFIAYKCFGNMCDREDKRNEYDQGQGEYPMQQYGQQPNYSQPQYDQHQQGGYPPQNQYPNQGGYPPQPQYPNQYNPNQAYPAYPHNPQY